MANNKNRLRTVTAEVVESTAAYEDYLENLADDALVESTRDYQVDLVQGSGEENAGLWDPDVKAFIDVATLKSLFFTEDWVYIVVDLIANKISAQALNVMHSTTVEGSFRVEKAQGHPFQSVIENPNNFQDYHAWMYGIVVDLILLGNTVMWAMRAKNQILPLPGEKVGIDFDKAGKLLRYTMREKLEDYVGDAAKLASFEPKDIVHLRRPNPGSMIWGLSPFIPGRRSILFNRYSTEYLNNFYLKGATPGLALEMDKEANEKVALRLLRSFEAAYTGRRNQRRTLVLPKGVTAKEVSHTIADQQLQDLVNMNRETILGILKVPKHEVGLQEAGSLGSEEYKTALKNFWSATLKPTMKIIAGGLTKFFAPQLGKNFFLEFELEDVEVLQDDEIKKAEKAEKMLKTHTLNEVRKIVYELDPIEGGDVVLDLVARQSVGIGAPGFLSQAPPAMGGPIMLPDVSAPADESKAETPQASDIVKVSKDNLVAFLKSDGDWFARREGKVRAAAVKASSQIEELALKMFSDQAVAIISATKKFLKEKGYGPAAEKATMVGNPKTTFVGKAELRRRLRKALDDYEERWVDGTRKALVATIDVGYDSMVEIPFNLPSKAEIDALKARGGQVRQEALDERSGRAFKYLNETTINDVYNTIDRAIDDGKTPAEIAEALRSRFSNIEEIGARAMTIARTETLTAVSLGQAAAMKDAATVIPNLKKMWLSADDDRVRDSHAAVDGEVVDWDKAFSNDLFFPRDPDGPPDEVIQCRCTFISLPADQMDEVSGDNIDSNEEV